MRVTDVYEVYRGSRTIGGFYWGFFRAYDTFEEALNAQQILEYKRGVPARVRVFDVDDYA